MKARPASFMHLRWAGTAGLVLGLFFFVALAASSTTGYVFANRKEAKGLKGIRGAAAAGPETGKGGPLHEQGDTRVADGGAREEGSSSPTKPSTDKEGVQGKVHENESVADKTEEDPSAPVKALEAEPEIPAGEPEEELEETDWDLEGSGSEIDVGSSQADHQSAPRGEEEGQLSHLSDQEEEDGDWPSSPSDLSSTTTTTTTTTGTVTTLTNVRVGSVMTSSSGREKGEIDQEYPSHLRGSASATGTANPADTTRLFDRVDGARVMTEVSAIPREQGEDREHRPSSLYSSSAAAVADGATTPASDTVDSAPTGESAKDGEPTPDNAGSTEEVGGDAGTGEQGERPQEDTPVTPGDPAGPEGGAQENGPGGGGSTPQAGEGGESTDGHGSESGTPEVNGQQKPEEQQDASQDQSSQQNQDSSSTTTTETTTSSSTSVVNPMSKTSWCTIAGMLTVAPFLMTA